MAYVPNPVDITDPVISRPAGSAAEEFRELKDYIQTLAVSAGKSTGARQTILQGVVNSSGYANMLSAGTGLTVKLAATAQAIVFAFAAGFNATVGAIDSYAQLTADTDPIISALSANNLSYIYADYVSVSSIAWDKTLVPPQYGYVFDRTENFLLHFDGIDAATSTTDDFGNTWTFGGNAQLDTAQQKFGSASLLLDGTGDFAKTNSITSLGDGSWEVSCWFRINASPGNGVVYGLISIRNAAAFGMLVQLQDTAGVEKLAFYASSTGTSFDIANNVSGTNTTFATGEWHRVRIVFDALAGTYRVYLSLNGAVETQDISVASTARICEVTQLHLGIASDEVSSPFNGWLDEFRLLRAASATAIETPKASAYAVNETNQLVCFFSIPEMKMYEVTSASAVAGTNPGMTARNRVFVAEADTSGVAVTAVRNYALRGEYISDYFTITASTTINKAHNIGVRPGRTTQRLKLLLASMGYTQGEELEVNYVFDGSTGRGGVIYLPTRNSMVLLLSNSTYVFVNKGTGIPDSTAYNTVVAQLRAWRGW